LALVNPGSLKHNSGRYAGRENAPQPTKEIGPAPKWFSKELKAIWREMVAAIPPGVVGNSDRILLEITCQLTNTMRIGIATSQEMAQLTSCLGKLGLTPSDRQKMAGPPSMKPAKQEGNPFAKFLNDSRTDRNAVRN
jgi:phage terminase small subunit